MRTFARALGEAAAMALVGAWCLADGGMAGRLMAARGPAGARQEAVGPNRPARAALPPSAPAEALAAGRRWWAHVRVLADDRLEGRLTGTEGYRQAADYVARRFQEYGLAPAAGAAGGSATATGAGGAAPAAAGAGGATAGVDGYFQPVRFEVQRVLAAGSRLALVRDSRREPLVLGADAVLGSRLWQPKVLDAPLAFAGYALHLPEVGYDDLAGQDLRGKVVVYLNGSPAGIAPALTAHGHASQEFYRALVQAGAAGAISIPDARSMDIPWARQALAASQPGMRLADPELQEASGPFFTATVNPARAERLFAGSGHTLGELQRLAAVHRPLPRFPLMATLHAEVATSLEWVESPNVVAVLPGSDPRLRAEYVVLSAHLDHLGIGEPIAGDRIYNGAMDNASGVAALLETARALRAAGAKPRRSILFLAVCGEEKGLLGSRYFAAHPSVPPGAIVADLNVDMFLPLFPLRYLTVQGLAESSLGDDVRAVGKAEGVEVVADREPDRNRFIRSDQYSFIRKGVPALALGFDAAPGSPEEKVLKTWITQRYHAPSDDVNQPVDLAAAGNFNRLLAELAERVANEDARPSWKAHSFFRRFAGGGSSAPVVPPKIGVLSFQLMFKEE